MTAHSRGACFYKKILATHFFYIIGVIVICNTSNYTKSFTVHTKLKKAVGDHLLFYRKNTAKIIKTHCKIMKLLFKAGHVLLN